VPFREESYRSSCIYSGPLHTHSRDAVSQHPSTRAGAESIQLIYSGRALQALSDLARQFQCHPIFWRELKDNEGVQKFFCFQFGGSIFFTQWEHDTNLRESRNTLVMEVKKSTKRVRGENSDSSTLCTPFEMTCLSSKP